MPASGVDVVQGGIGVGVHPQPDEALGYIQMELLVSFDEHRGNLRQTHAEGEPGILPRVGDR